MTAPTTLSKIFTDWGGFEQFVAELHRTGSVTVEHDVTLTGRSGAPRQIDVLVRHREGLYDHLIVVECKYHKSSVKRHHVDAMAKTIQEVGASRGVIFSTQGFQRGAIDQAAHDNIGLFKVRPLDDEEWGLPGRHIDLWLQTIELSIGAFEAPGSMRAGPAPNGPLTLILDATEGQPSSRTPLEIPGRPPTTLENLLVETARTTARAIHRPLVLDFEGSEEGQYLRKFKIRIKPEKAAAIATAGTVLLLPEIGYELGLRITQSRIAIDRGSDYVFVLALEDCVSKVVTIASRPASEAHTMLNKASNERETSDAYQNGSLASIWLASLLPFSTFDDVPISSDAAIHMSLDLLGA